MTDLILLHLKALNVSCLCQIINAILLCESHIDYHFSITSNLHYNNQLGLKHQRGVENLSAPVVDCLCWILPAYARWKVSYKANECTSKSSTVVV